MTAPQLHLPRTVVSDQTERAVDLLGHYFTSGKFIGSQWDGFDPSGTSDQLGDMVPAAITAQRGRRRPPSEPA